MEKIWLQHYDEGVPSEINPDQYAALPDLFAAMTEQYANKPCFAHMKTTLSYVQTARYSDWLAGYFSMHWQLKKGDRIALMLPNCLQYPLALFASLKLGLIVVNINPLYTPRELKHVLQDSKAKAIVVLANVAHTLESCLPLDFLSHILITELGDCFSTVKKYTVNFFVKSIKGLIPTYHLPEAEHFSEVLAQGEHLKPIYPILTGHDIAFLQYTGGTTGLAKGAMLSHGNMVANILQAKAFISPAIQTGEEIIITPLPLYHIFALLANLLVFFCCGGLNVLITNPRDVKTLLSTMSDYRFTAITGVNTLFNLMLNHQKLAQVDFSHCRLCLAGGMSLQKKVADLWQEKTGCPVLQAYGLTEASPGVCINPVSTTQYTGKIGLPIPSTEISIRDEHDNELPVGAKGELWVRGPQVMQGYWQATSETKKILTQDGWLKTGDIATVDSLGFVSIVDRKKELIIVSGFNVYPSEIEAVILTLEGVEEVAVVGVTSETPEEKIKAFIVRKKTHLDKQTILTHCRQNLVAYKIPQSVVFVDSLPKSPVGKILKRELH